jgi:hypothetical protein
VFEVDWLFEARRPSDSSGRFCAEGDTHTRLFAERDALFSSSARPTGHPFTDTLMQTMASQHDSGIPFGFSHDQQAFRLLELPPALLAALESPNPPTYVLPRKTRDQAFR